MMITMALTGCGKIGDKSANMSVIYGVMIFSAIVLFVIYGVAIREKEIWFLMLATSIVIVNIGYLSLSISKTIEEALLANRIAYLGSVFLPMAMFMIIIRTCNINYIKWIPSILLIMSICVFIVAASPGYLDIYYKSVTLQKVNGCTVLEKTYGPWHSLYLIYLLAYFSAMVITIVQASIKNKIASIIHVIILAGAVLVNIGVWMMGQLINIEFEFLSVSYVITEFFMLCLYIIIQEQDIILRHNYKENDIKECADDSIYTDTEVENIEIENIKLQNTEVENIELRHTESKKKELVSNELIDRELENNQQIKNSELVDNGQKELFISGVKKLTPKESVIYNYYIQGKKTKEIMKELEITENTLKYHNKNIYGKLGVTSRKQLRICAEQYM
jgi:DNA-binding CsgD family transcriptional regulator